MTVNPAQIILAILLIPLIGCSGSGEVGEMMKADRTSQKKTSGKYVTIWEKQSNGSWKFVLDCGNEGLLIPGF